MFLPIVIENDITIRCLISGERSIFLNRLMKFNCTWCYEDFHKIGKRQRGKRFTTISNLKCSYIIYVAIISPSALVENNEIDVGTLRIGGDSSQ